jgi:hypothetical protein
MARLKPAAIDGVGGFVLHRYDPETLAWVRFFAAQNDVWLRSGLGLHETTRGVFGLKGSGAVRGLPTRRTFLWF